MAEGQVSSRDLALAYMERIKAIDGGGPRLCSILEVNPEALATAEAMDEERAVTGPRGPLHGVCVLLKDNIDTGDSMHTTAGSLALLDSVPGGGDATIVSKLRHAGAVILGKANLSEWANYRGNSSSGWSARGGQCKNPHVLDNTPSGSSSGSGAAVAAALTAVAVGSETDGSIVSPADVCGVCGVKPTVGLLSRAGIVPISAEQDTPGPMCRSLADCAALLTVLAGPDPAADADPPHAPPITGGGGPPLDYAAEMASKGTNGGLKGARIGVLRSKFGAQMRRQKVGCDGWSVGQKTCALLPSPERSAELLEGSCLQPLRRAGATLVDVELWDQGELEAAFPGGMHELHESYQLTLGYQFARDIGRYLRTRVAHPALDPATACLPRTLADLVLFNVTHRDEELQVFGQERWEEAIRTHQQRSQVIRVRVKIMGLIIITAD
jgi:amidase